MVCYISLSIQIQHICLYNLGCTYISTICRNIQRWPNKSLIRYYVPSCWRYLDCALNMAWTNNFPWIGYDGQRLCFNSISLNWTGVGSDLAKRRFHKIWYFNISIVCRSHTDIMNNWCLKSSKLICKLCFKRCDWISKKLVLMQL